MEADRELALTGGLVLRPDDDEPVPGTVVFRRDHIVSVDEPGAVPDGSEVIDLRGRWILPGIVDIHGDGFERCLMPRPGVTIGVELALADNDAQLLAAGITTSYLSATDSWEPGLRSRATLLELAEALFRRRQRRQTGPAPEPDVRLHVRHERCNTEAIGELVNLVAAGQVELLSYNDHTSDDPERISLTQIQRTGLDAEALGSLQVDRAGQRQLGADQERELAAAAAEVGCPTASHDAATPEHLARDLALGVTIAEFPTSIELASRYRAAGMRVLLGAPNLVRGGSHLANLAVADALAAGTGDMLCSDYHYPSLFQAPFVAAADGSLSFGAAWRQVSTTPALASGLGDRGRLAPGQRADLVVVEPPEAGATGLAVLDRVVVGGRLLGRR